MKRSDMLPIVPLRGILRICVLALTLCVAPASAAEPNNISPNREFQYQLPRASGAIDVDGHLTETAWDTALEIDLAYETSPGENIDPQVETRMLMLYDDRFLYVGFRAFDPDPKAIRAHVKDRDKPVFDDIIGIILDPFNDGRRAFEFFCNPLGVQLDFFFDDITDQTDFNWNAIWRSAGHIDREGYVVEMAIPFNALRFPKAPGEQTWSFDGVRVYPRDQQYDIRTQPRYRDIDCKICQNSKITGFAGASPGRNFELNPTVTGNQTDARAQLADPELESGDIDPDVGLDARWGVTPNLLLSATLNPDFSQVEADVAQLDVNTRFALFFPETRPFFQEDADFFETSLNIVHTRTVGDPDWGLRLTGKMGRNAIAAFVARDAVTNLLIPGSQVSRATVLDEENDLAVVRFRRDLKNNSNVGILVTDREGENGYSNRLAGFDGLIRFNSRDSISFQVLGSQTRYSPGIIEEFGQPAEADDLALRLGFDHRGREWLWYGRYDDIGEEFRADLGFMPQVDFSEAVGGVQRTWWGEGDDWFTEMRLGGEWNLEEDQAGRRLDRGGKIWYAVKGPRQSELSATLGRRQRFFSNHLFEESFRDVFVSIRPSGTFFFSLFARTGDEIDFVNVRPADQLLLEPAINLNLGRHLEVDLNHTFNRLETPEGDEIFTANQSEMRLVYQLNLRSFIRLITQYLDVERDPAHFVESRTQDLFNQLLFSYKLNARTVFFAGYSDNSQAFDNSMTGESLDLRSKSRTVFLKVGYAWVF